VHSQAQYNPNEPPLGGRFVDGTKSMFIKSPTSPMSSSFNPDPLQRAQMTAPPHASTVGRAGNFDPLSAPTSPALQPYASGQAGNGLDPLGQAKPNLMTGSVRVQPTRPRLDAKEAASKLANMF
jgi:hypothetical protein